MVGLRLPGHLKFGSPGHLSKVFSQPNGLPLQQQHQVMSIMDTGHAEGHTHDLLKFSYLHGLVGLATEKMQDLIADIPIPVARLPSGEKACFNIIGGHCFSHFSTKQFDALFAKRGAERKKRMEEQDNSDLTANHEIAEGILHEKDLGTLNAVLEEKRAYLVAQAENLRRSRVGVRTDFRSDSICLSFARAFVPGGEALCHLKKDVTLHWRWQGELLYRPKPGNTASKAWVKPEDVRPPSKVSEGAALKIVLKKLWAIYITDHPGEQCPHNFDEIFED